MIYKNMLELDIPSVSSIIKVGDTISDIQEGVNAGCISVGIIEGSSELGLSLEEFVRIDAEDKYSIMNKVRYRMYGAGANYVLNNISELPELINWINKLKEL
jgi:phosphonoacetaldehyde hydrolase